MDNENGFHVYKLDESVSQKPEENKKRAVTAKEIFDWVDTVIVALIAVVIVFSFFFRIATISGDSMQTTLYDGEKIIISNLFYEPKFGDIVVISRNTYNSVNEDSLDNEPIIKRVIATSGQFVDIDFESGKVFVGDSLSNMVELDEPYTKTPTNREFDVKFPVYVEEGHIFVLGDNRNDSLDSRSTTIGNEGLVDKRYILGKAVYRIWPFDVIGGL